MQTTLPILHALKHLTYCMESLEKKIDDMQAQIEAMQTEWRFEYEPDSDTESLSEVSESSESDLSTVSAPASFSLEKRQRTE